MAVGMVPLAVGSDAGRSVRIPASLCGVVGLKPSLGRVPVHLLPTDFEPILHVGPVARSVADAALLLSVMQDPDERDPLSLVPSLEFPARLEADLSGLPIALSVDLGYYRIHPAVEANTRPAADLPAERGDRVEEVELPWTREINDAWFAYWAVLLTTLFGHLLASHRELLDPEVARLMERGRRMSALELKRIDLVRTRQWAALRPVLEEHHALLCPTVAVSAPPAEGRDADFGADTPDGRSAGYDLAAPFNFLSPCPALSVPSGLDDQGLPTGLQIVARRYRDLLALRLGTAWEETSPWRRPWWRARAAWTRPDRQ